MVEFHVTCAKYLSSDVLSFAVEPLVISQIVKAVDILKNVCWGRSGLFIADSLSINCKFHGFSKCKLNPFMFRVLGQFDDYECIQAL